jgi:hypothetical protein
MGIIRDLLIKMNKQLATPKPIEPGFVIPDCHCSREERYKGFWKAHHDFRLAEKDITFGMLVNADCYWTELNAKEFGISMGKFGIFRRRLDEGFIHLTSKKWPTSSPIVGHNYF